MLQLVATLTNTIDRCKWPLAVALAFLLAAVLVLGGCAASGTGSDNSSARQDSETSETSGTSGASGSSDASGIEVPLMWDDVQQACDSVVQSSTDGNLVGVEAEVDESTKTIYLTFTTISEDALEACDSAEEVCRQLSSDAVQAMIDRLAEEGDEEAEQSYAEFASEETDRAEGLGVLYEYYALSLLVDNDQGTLDIDGTRAAGAEGSINWQ